MQTQLSRILQEAKDQIKKASSQVETEEIRVKILGKKGELTDILKSMGKLAPEERKSLGAAANSVRAEIEGLLEEKFAMVKEAAKQEKFKLETIDVTEPGVKYELGVKHPLTITIEEISRVFMSMGFSIAEGPEVETVFNNFDALNAGPNHPARDFSDTFYISEDILLRTQTSPVQARTLMKQKPPIKIISPGRCFRCDTPDATHSPMFHQVEGLVVDEGITMADLKGTLDSFAKQLFGSDSKTKFRPHHFPFTEPSAEMDVSCFKCGGKGCNVCKGSGWIEILGCGMVHPNVLKVGKIDTEKYTGFAFGMGVERIAMLKYGVDDIRNFYENDMRFINQFK
ncbi:phenylalanine--tRNA ligase subunit alpha [Aminipila luticellarii]|uniref:Phenylalanine--tRNA ligase alpha subunit n=1 Tax=Aminipila luticellarii TaxID=2507160 RepID=A0A410PWN3_9FIRM|nr:phenylalanine--tRNA ligase subunit alpha [Aminipila luticellarii]QAT43300.1 phenylalanine--tRNA ligase subunit alpha [Aminipila luticellarii]